MLEKIKRELQIWLEIKKRRAPKAVQYPSSLVCSKCGENMIPIAHWTGDGWALNLDCKCQIYIEDFYFEWPFFDDYASAKDMENAGFKLV